jgi:glutamate synthase domain-containing protein 3
VIAGNVALYGATSGRAFFRGLAGERFAVRNSGACAVVEGVGDHGCEYMTGGRVAVIGPVGVNFAAGMSGGVAWVLDPRNELAGRANPALVDLEDVGADLGEELRQLLVEHMERTGSAVARGLLDDWDRSIMRFTQVMPRDYRAALQVAAQWDPPTEGGQRAAGAAA